MMQPQPNVSSPIQSAGAVTNIGAQGNVKMAKPIKPTVTPQPKGAAPTVGVGSAPAVPVNPKRPPQGQYKRGKK